MLKSEVRRIGKNRPAHDTEECFEAIEAVMKAGQYAYRDRRQRKRQFRNLWIVRINAACRELGLTYSLFINGLTKANVAVDRKVLSALAIDDKAAFAKFVEIAKAHQAAA